jgi:hypothetical protein
MDLEFILFLLPYEMTVELELFVEEKSGDVNLDLLPICRGICCSFAAAICYPITAKLVRKDQQTGRQMRRQMGDKQRLTPSIL